MTQLKSDFVIITFDFHEYLVLHFFTPLELFNWYLSLVVTLVVGNELLQSVLFVSANFVFVSIVGDHIPEYAEKTHYLYLNSIIIFVGLKCRTIQILKFLLGKQIMLIT